MRLFTFLFLLLFPFLSNAGQIVPDSVARKARLSYAREKIVFDDAQRSAFSIREEYNYNGNCVCRRMTDDITGETNAADYFIYDRNNRLTAHRNVMYRTVNDSDISSIDISSSRLDSINNPRYTYDSNGNITVATTGKMKTFYKYRFDSTGRVRYCEMRTIAGNEEKEYLLSTESNTYTYKADGGLQLKTVSQYYMGDTPQPVLLNENETVVDYDSRGLPLKKTVRDIKVSEGIEPKNSVSVFEYQFYK